MLTFSGKRARDTRSAPRRTATSTDAVLTAEGRALLARKAAELRSVIVPALLAAVVDDRHDEQTRSAYDDKLGDLLRLEPEVVESFRLVHPVEAPLDRLRISVTSPLGQAVLGRRCGDLVEVNAPAGRQIVRILDAVQME